MGNCLVPKWLFWVVISVFLLHCDESSGCVEKEKLALLQIKEQFSSFSKHPHLLLPSWSDESFSGNCCLWEKVICDPFSVHIIHLSLGSLPILLSSDYFYLGFSLNMTAFQDLEELQILDLSNNKIARLVEDKAMCKLRSLQVLNLKDNEMDGGIPNCVGNLSFLKQLELSNNLLAGNIPSGLFNLKGLQVLDLSTNDFDGNLPTCIYNLSSLEHLSLSPNQLNGNIPSGLCNLKRLQMLDLSENYLNGSLPKCLCKLAKLESLKFHGDYLHLNNNTFSGYVPHELSTCSNLKVLNLRGNQLVANIPLSIGQLSKLLVLQLGYNKLQGKLPKQLCHLKYLNILDVANNEISGTIPPCLKDLSFGLTTPLMSPEEGYLNFITKGRYISYVGSSVSLMSGLDLSCNRLSGQIPSDLGNLMKTRSLNLSHNKLNGLIPTTFSMLRNIESLDLSYNDLSGPIPAELVKLNFLEVFNVSYNNLSGRVPLTGQFGTFGVSSYEGNPFLSGYDQGRNSSGGKSPNSSFGDDKGNTEFDWRLFFWSFGPSCIIFLVGSVMVVYNNPQWINACCITIYAHIRCRFFSLY